MFESKKRALIFFILAFILACVAGYLVYQKIIELNEHLDAELGEMQTIYVASVDLPAREPLKEEHITTAEIPSKYFNDSFITDQSQIINYVSVVSLKEGDVFTKNIIKPITELNDPNNRLVAIGLSDTVRLDQSVGPLDRVDIIVSRDDDGEKVTEIFMRDVTVMYVGDVGIGVELPLEEARELIHAQHYYEYIRILKTTSTDRIDDITDIESGLHEEQTEENTVDDNLTDESSEADEEDENISTEESEEDEEQQEDIDE